MYENGAQGQEKQKKCAHDRPVVGVNIRIIEMVIGDQVIGQCR